MDKIKITTNQSKNVFSVFDILKTVAYVLVVISLIFIFLIRDANVVGNSMMDTLHGGDKVLISNLAYTPECGDVVVITTDKLEEKHIVKRIIAKEGQTLRIDYEKGSVIVDGIEIKEDYRYTPTQKPFDALEIPEVIPEGYVFVMGDNREVSLDSRYEKLGLIPVKDIIGKAEFVFYPFNRIKYLY